MRRFHREDSSQFRKACIPLQLGPHDVGDVSYIDVLHPEYWIDPEGVVEFSLLPAGDANLNASPGAGALDKLYHLGWQRVEFVKPVDEVDEPEGLVAFGQKRLKRFF